MMTLEQAQEIRNSSIWQWVEKELDYRIKSLLDRLRTCGSEELEMLQLKVQLLEEFKRLPDDVVDREHPGTVLTR
jgi:hypothetical protein